MYIWQFSINGTVSPSSRGRGLKYLLILLNDFALWVALFTRAWIEIHPKEVVKHCNDVALFTRAWIEMQNKKASRRFGLVALFTRAWIEISQYPILDIRKIVALFTRAWIEIVLSYYRLIRFCRPLHEGVD